ncbi:CHAT domain-containing protein, partial [Synechococcus lacustris]|uniref:CHAT domain-containing protein n=1 Tax=Synechococcus lacustris TaxID=2116544 RepID=UPI00333FB3D0
MGAENLWCPSCPETTIQITANIEPYQSSTTSLNLVGRQIVLGLWPERNNITSGTVVEFTSYLGGGLYSASVLLPKTVTPSTDADVKRDDYVDSFLGWFASLNDSEKAAMRDLNPGAYFKEVLGPEGSIKGFAPVAAPATAQSQAASIPAAPAAVLAPTTPDRTASAQVIASLEQSEQSNSEKVAFALGLSLQEAAKAPSTVDIQADLRAAIASVRTAAGKQAGLGLDPGLGLLASAATNNQALLNPAFNRAAYNPAVLHLRYSTAAVGGFDGQLDLVLITATGEPKGIRVPLRQADFRDSLQKLYGALSRQENLAVNDPNGPSRSLYRQIFTSLEPILQEQKITTLLLSADQGLQAIPYAALHNGKQFLGEQYGLSLTPSLNLTNLQAPLGRGGDLLALGASSFDGLAPLPLVPEELRAVSIGQKSEIFLNQAFTPSSLLISAAEPRFRRVHVATHAEFLPGGPSQSRIYTGTGAVALKEFANLRSRRADASLDLISLSACRTAIGDPDSELGFAGLALQAGARSAIGSLWYVDDVATSAFFV